MIDENHPLFDHLISTIAELLHEFNIDFNGFCDALRTQHVTNVYQQCKSFSQTALITGIDRRTISAIINGHTLYSKQSQLPAIIKALQTQAQTDNMRLHKSGLYSLAHIIEQNTTTANSTKLVINVLCDAGIIVDQGAFYQFIGQAVPSEKDIQSFVDRVAQLMASIAVALEAEKGSQDIIMH